MSNEIFLYNKEREIVKDLKEEKNSYYDYYPNSLFENIPDLNKNEFKYISSYETISKITGEDTQSSVFGEFQLNDDIDNNDLFLPNLPREPTDFVSILSFPYTNKNYHSSNTKHNNIQSFSNNLKRKNGFNENKNSFINKNKYQNKNTFDTTNSNFQLWNQLPNKKSFLTSKSNNWDLKDKDKKIYTYDNGVPFQSPYLTEINLNLYEEIYQMYYNHQYSFGQYNKIIEEKELIKDILNMVVGISSQYFTYDLEQEKFVIKNLKVQYLRIVGCDGQSLSRYLQTYLDMGTNFKRLEKLSKIYQSNPE